MDFHSELVKITEFAPLEEYLVKKKAGELLKTSQAKVITVAVNPSNLVELTKVGERFAPDSCVLGKDLKYVLHEKLIPNKEKPTHFESLARFSEFSSLDSSFPRVLPIIPDMIVRQRPGISYQPIKEVSYSSVSQESSLFDQDLKSNNTETPPGQLLKPVGRVIASEKALNEPKNSSYSQNKTSKAGYVKNVKSQPEKSTVTIKRANSFKEPLKNSSVEKTFKEIRGPSATLGKKKMKKKVKTILKKNQSEDTNLSSNSEKKTVTWEEDEKNLQREHEEKRKMHLDKFKYQCPSYLREKDSETLNRLEKIVEEEKELLKEKGIVTPESSQGSKYKKTYEELEREIKNIREMLSEDREKPNSVEGEEEDEDYEEREISDYDEASESHENASIDYNYSSDDCKDDKEWMKPRFK
jgi:hypothetical protein